jgi:hypothetical protein
MPIEQEVVIIKAIEPIRLVAMLDVTMRCFR